MRAVNLLPRAEPRKHRKKIGLAAQLAIIAPLVLAAFLAAGTFLTKSKVNDRAATLQALQEELAALPEASRPAQVDAQLAAQHDERVSALAGALRTRVAWDRIMRQISSILPEDVWLTSLSAKSPSSPGAPATEVVIPTTPAPSGATVDAAPPAAAAPSASPLTINGYTYSQEGVARFLSRLSVIPDLTKVTLKRSENAVVAGRIVVRFTIEASIRELGA